MCASSNTMFLVSVFTVLVSVLSFAQAASSFHLSPAETSPLPTTQRFNFFDIELMRSSANALKGNFMVSPASVKATLAMLLEGANGDCGSELRRALRLPESSSHMREQLNNYLSSLKAKTPGIVLESANKVFLSRKFEVIKSYQKLLMEVYYSEIQTVNFEDPLSTAQSINSWISKQTYGFIEELVDPFSIEANSVLILANALYFKGVWNNSFSLEDTHPQCFHTEEGCKDVYMMENQGDFNYGFISEMNAQAIELPYVGDRYSMLILLPTERFGADLLVKDLPFVPLTEILSQMESTDMQVSLPRFQIDFNDNLVDILQDVGVNLIFTPQANLTGIVKGDISPLVNNIFHKTKIQVNEEGAVAAAGTGAMVIPLMGTNTGRFLADHQFLFFIRDKKTGAVLFEGRVNEPELVTKTTTPPSYFQPSNTARPAIQQPTVDYDKLSQLLSTTQAPNKKKQHHQNPSSSQSRPVQSQARPSQSVNSGSTQPNSQQFQSNSNQFIPSTNTNQISQSGNYGLQGVEELATGTGDRFLNDDFPK